MAVAIADAFRNIRVIQPSVPESVITTVAAEVVGDTFSITAGLGITITADPETDTVVISNTGNGTGAYTEISDTNSNSTFYPLFSRPFEPTDINPLDVPPSYQLDAIYVDNTSNPMTYNPSSGTLTAVNFVGALTGNASTVTNGVYTSGSYSDPTWLTISQSFVGLGNVTNESKATMFSSPTFTGTVSGVTATMVGLGNVTNESKATMFSSPTFTGTVSGVTATMVGLGNVTNESKATMFSSPTFTGTVSGITSTMVGLGNVENTALSTSTHYIGTTSIQYNRASASQTLNGVSIDGNAGTVTDGVYTSGSYSDPTWLTISQTFVGLGNVTNESKATMFTSPTFTGTTTLQQSTEVLDTKTSATGTVVHDFSTGSIWYHSSISANFTVNITNVPTTSSRAIVCTLVLTQGVAAYIPTALQIDGVGQTINWQGGSIAGTANKIDVVSFTLLRIGSTWSVLGSLTNYG